MARIPKHPSKVRSQNCSYKATPKEKRALVKAAKSAQCTLSEYVRYWVPELNGGLIQAEKPEK